MAGETMPPVDLEPLALSLFDIGAVRLGQFVLHSGRRSPIYFDLRLLVSYPAVLRQVAAAYALVLRRLQFDILAAYPYAGLPIGTAIALEMNIPLIYPRKTAKSYGTGKQVEGVAGGAAGGSHRRPDHLGRQHLAGHCRPKGGQLAGGRCGGAHRPGAIRPGDASPGWLQPARHHQHAPDVGHPGTPQPHHGQQDGRGPGSPHLRADIDETTPPFWQPA